MMLERLCCVSDVGEEARQFIYFCNFLKLLKKLPFKTLYFLIIIEKKYRKQENNFTAASKNLTGFKLEKNFMLDHQNNPR
jgi:hypothetical protein